MADFRKPLDDVTASETICSKELLVQVGSRPRLRFLSDTMISCKS